MKISVVVPTFNRAHTVLRAVQSVQQQTVQPHEIIVVDDGSVDQTHALLRTMNVHIIRQDNQGVSSARNAGILAAEGDWIALLDSDDQWLPNKLELQTRLLQENSTYKFCHANERWVRNGKHLNQKHIHRKHGGWIFERCLPLCVISPSAALLRKDLLIERGLFDVSYPACEDYDLWLRICAHEPVLYIDKPLLIKYGGHEDQLSRKYWGMDRFRIRALQNIIANGGLSSQYRQAAINMLQKKAVIFAKGARKRGRIDEAIRYEHIAKAAHD